MPQQLTDEQWAYYQGQDQKAKFVESIYNDPALNNDAKALIKKKYPNLQIPDYDLRKQVNDRFDEMAKAREDEKRAASEAEQLRLQEEKRASTQKRYSLTDEGMNDLEKFMVDNHVGDYEVAAGYRHATNPKPSDATYDDFGRTRWNHMKQEGIAEIAKDPEAWGQSEIMKALRRDQERAKAQSF